MECPKFIALGTLRHFPVLIVLFWLAYVTLSQFMEVPVALVDLLEVVLGFTIVGIFSFRFKFCIIHRLCILYAFLCTLAMWYEQFFGFGEYLTLSHVVAAILGVAICIALVVKQVKTIRCQDETK